MSRRLVVTAISVLGLVGTFGALAFSNEPGEPGGVMLFAPFVALLAFEYGAAVGVVAGVGGIALFAGAMEIADARLTTAELVGRLVPMVILGGGIGWLNSRLRERDELYRRMVETSAELVCVIEPDSTIGYANERSRDILGYEPEELVGRPVTVVLDEAEARRVAERIARRQAGYAESLSYDIRLRHKDGHEVFGFANSAPLRDANGAFVGSLAMIADMTDRRLMEDELRERDRALGEAQAIAHVGSWTWDVPRNRVAWSDELCRIFGVDPREFDGTYEAFVERLHPADRERVNDAVQEAYENGRPFAIEHRIVRPDGETRLVEARGAVFRGEDGTVVRMAGTGYDVTDRRQTEAALDAAQVARRQARELNDTVVQGLVLAKYALDRGETETAAALVVSTLEAARRVIDDLLGEAAVEPGHLRREAAAGIGE